MGGSPHRNHQFWRSPTSPLMVQEKPPKCLKAGTGGLVPARALMVQERPSEPWQGAPKPHTPALRVPRGLPCTMGGLARVPLHSDRGLTVRGKPPKCSKAGTGGFGEPPPGF